MTALPAATAITFPVLSTVATAGADDFQFNFLFVAFTGATSAVICTVSFSFKLTSVLSRVIPVTFTSGFVTVTLHVAVTPLPSVALQVMTALPAATAVTLPVLSTVATADADDFQFSFLFVAFVGATSAIICTISFSFSVTSVLFRLIPVI